MGRRKRSDLPPGLRPDDNASPWADGMGIARPRWLPWKMRERSPATVTAVQIIVLLILLIAGVGYVAWVVGPAFIQ